MKPAAPAAVTSELELSIVTRVNAELYSTITDNKLAVQLKGGLCNDQVARGTLARVRG
jgi:hypothetical protein